MACNENTINFKRGDDFRLDMTIKNKNSVQALAAQADVVSAQATLDAANAAVPSVAQDITDAQTALDAAQAAYDLAIIVDITDWVITSNIRWNDKFVDALDVVIINAAVGQMRIARDDTLTTSWPKRLLDCDVKFDIPVLGKTSSKTFYIDLRGD